jgi:hypothetical protein
MRPRRTLRASWPVVRMLGEDRRGPQDPFVNGFPFSLDASHEFEYSTCAVLLRQVCPVREGHESEGLALDPARVKSVLRSLLLP